MRRDARDTAFRYLFSTIFQDGNDLQDDIYDFNFLNEQDKKFCNDLIALVLEHREEFLNILDDISLNFKVERMFLTDKTILLIAMAEMKYISDIPNVVSINEAISLGKQYSSEDSVVFINGILAKFNKEITENV